MKQLKDFYTRSGITTKFILKDINGKDSGHWFTVIGTESTEWRKNRQERIGLRQFNNEIAGVSDVDRDSAQWLSRIVSGWSFPDEFDRKSVEDFLYNTPYILDQLDSFIYDKETFFKKK